LTGEKDYVILVEECGTSVLSDQEKCVAWGDAKVILESSYSGTDIKEVLVDIPESGSSENVVLRQGDYMLATYGFRGNSNYSQSISYEMSDT
jgi:hypothetical protein